MLPDLKESMLIARRELSENPQQAIELLCQVLEQIFRFRCQTVVLNGLQKCPPPLDLIRIVNSELGFCVYPRNLPDVAKAALSGQELLAYVELVDLQLPRERLWTERVSVFCQQRLSQSFLSFGGSARILPSSCQSLSLRVRMIRMQLLAGVHRLVCRQHEIHKSRETLSVRLVSYLLGEPESRAFQLLSEQAHFSARFYFLRRLHLAGHSDSATRVGQFVWPDQAAYGGLALGAQQSRVLVTIHMGDFVGALKRLATQSSKGRSVTSLRRESDSDVENIRALFEIDPRAHQVAIHGQAPAQGMISALRAGSHTLTALFDLHDDFGETVIVQFFGHPARLVKGPAVLAILGKAHIVPFVTYFDGRNDVIEMAPIIDTRLLGGESLSAGVHRITQSLASLAEKWIRRHPAQWKYLNTMGSFFVRGDKNGQGAIQDSGISTH